MIDLQIDKVFLILNVFHLIQIVDASLLIRTLIVLVWSTLMIRSLECRTDLHYNQNSLYKSSCFDAKFITISIASLIWPQEMREGSQIAQNDARLKFTRHLFQQQSQSDIVRMAWFEEHISRINEWITQLANKKISKISIL